MSISLALFKIEVAADYPLLSHINYVSPKALRHDYSARLKGTDLTESQVVELKKESRGCREVHEITIESVDLDAVWNMASKKDLAALDQEKSHEAQTGEKVKVSTCSEIPFFSGNHCVEVTRGIIHLFKENQQTSLSETERSEMLCMLAVPSIMTLHDLLQFIAPVSVNVENIRVIRDSKPNLYMVLIKFRSQKSADEFYHNFNGIRFNSIEPEVCHLIFVSRLEMVKESEDDTSCLPIPGHTELPTCPVCLERMDESVEGILTILCNHSFHDSCLAKWGDTSCPVCRYSQTPEPVPDNRCFSCGSQENLWICLICGHIGCGRYVEAHAYNHYARTGHTFAMQLGNNSVWDYAGDNYVHRLIQNKTDGKLVQLENLQTDSDEKLDSVQLEYTYLLTSQLENQRRYFEDCMDVVQKENMKQINELKEKTQIAVEERKELERKLSQVTKDKETARRKSDQLASQLSKTKQELQEEREMNKCLRENQQDWQRRLKDVETKLLHVQQSKDKEIQDLQEQLRDLMFYLDAKDKISSASSDVRQEIQEGTIVVGASGSQKQQRRRRNC
ncbi:BRCA1-associated protein-like [Ornithodoros turicata]|uniref:Putative cytoplasmic zn-finger protein n=1 Tax=Ornithodoros turicata TaxID=34597 RepID=A0A2R5LNJ3_9ACAR